jgi:uncharacterized protein
MEVAHVESFSSPRGTQIGVASELRWELLDDALRVELAGGTSLEVRLGGADFFDLQDSPFFNSLPVMRDGLLEGSSTRDYVMRFVQRPELTDQRLRQTYVPLGDRVVRLTAGDFEADIEFDAEGLVSLYEGYLERVK